MFKKSLSQTPTELREAFKACRGGFFWVAGFSLFINMLMFVGPLYMLQVYDRVLTSRSEVTLVMLTVLAIGLLMVYGLLESIRSRILVRLGLRLDRLLNPQLLDRSFRILNLAQSGQSQALKDLSTIREFLTGPGLLAFFDAPWVPIFIAVGFLLHPLLGLVSLVGALVIFGLALANELRTRGPLREAGQASIAANQYITASLRNAEVVRAMGMMEGVRRRWEARNADVLGLQAKASDRAGQIVAASKFVRMSLQVCILGTGAFLAVENVITPGIMIAASIIMGRALAPVEMAVGQWKTFINARSAYGRLSALFAQVQPVPERMSLPAPSGHLAVESLTVTAPGGRTPLLRGLNFELTPGDVLGVVGPSGSGKSTLARALVGVWPVLNGCVRLDGAELTQYNPSELGPSMGYLPQDVELFAGSVAENIARFDDVDPDAVVLAAQRAGVHDLILQLPRGYDTPIGEGGQALSGGQRQRIALARALYGDPRLIILDEPNANLDSDGEQALAKALAQAGKEGRTVVVMTHRMSLLSVVNKMAVLQEGTLRMFGPRDAVMTELNKAKGGKALPKGGTNRSS